MNNRICALAFAVLPAAAAANMQNDAAADNAWTLLQGTTGCSASRVIAGTPAITVTSRRFFTGYNANSSVLTFRIPDAVTDKYTFAFKAFFDGEETSIGSGNAYLTAPTDAPTTAFRIVLSDHGEERLQQGLSDDSALVLSADGKELYRVPISQFAAKASGIEECFAQLGEALLRARPAGEDENAPARGPVPKNYMGRWVTNNDYRSSWINREIAGVVRFELSVGRYGFVEECTVTETSGYKPLDDQTCRLRMRRARFYPGRDQDQRAVGGTFQSAVSWQIPR